MDDSHTGEHERHTLYIFGNPLVHGTKQASQIALGVLSPVRNGWRMRSTLRDAMNHDYMCNEMLHTILDEWLPHDMAHAFFTFDRCEALKLLQEHADPSALGSPKAPRLESFVQGDPTVRAEDQVERVLQHLESGW